MELINECTGRFADEKDYRLLVSLLFNQNPSRDLPAVDRRFYYGAISD